MMTPNHFGMHVNANGRWLAQRVPTVERLNSVTIIGFTWHSPNGRFYEPRMRRAPALVITPYQVALHLRGRQPKVLYTRRRGRFPRFEGPQ